MTLDNIHFAKCPVIQQWTDTLTSLSLFLDNNSVFLANGDPARPLLQLRAKSWFEPMDGRPLVDHMVSLSLQTGPGAKLVVFAPINPVVYSLPPTLWISGTLGPR